ncbi:hypothetical protein BC833DRAFT_568043 [Globomyces pollinis-pini]|nr:hypothetical protein BC833DRAFT_568043 [Globomyces pollinis-pini]
MINAEVFLITSRFTSLIFTIVSIHESIFHKLQCKLTSRISGLLLIQFTSLKKSSETQKRSAVSINWDHFLRNVSLYAFDILVEQCVSAYAVSDMEIYIDSWKHRIRECTLTSTSIALNEIDKQWLLVDVPKTYGIRFNAVISQPFDRRAINS